MEFCYF